MTIYIFLEVAYIFLSLQRFLVVTYKTPEMQIPEVSTVEGTIGSLQS